MSEPESVKKIIDRLCEQSRVAQDGMAEVLAEYQRRKADKAMMKLDGIDREFLRLLGIEN